MKKKLFALLVASLMFGGMASVNAASSTGWKAAPSNFPGYIATSATYSLTSQYSNILGSEITMYSTNLNQLPSNMIADSTRMGYVILYEKDLFSSTPFQHYTMYFNGRIFEKMDWDSTMESGIIESDGTAEIYIESLIQKRSADASVVTGSVYQYTIGINY